VNEKDFNANAHTNIMQKTKKLEKPSFVCFLMAPFSPKRGPGQAHMPASHLGRPKSLPVEEVNQTATANIEKKTVKIAFSSKDIFQITFGCPTSELSGGAEPWLID